MKNLPAPDRELLIPILIGGLSVVGILVIFLIGRARNAPVEVTMTPSVTQFQYIYLGTEPAVTTLEVEGSELPVTGEPIFEDPFTEEPVLPVFDTPTRPVATAIILTLPNTTNIATTVVVPRTSTPSRTATSSSAGAITYDDTDSWLIYDGGWISQTGLNGAYQGTLHISNAIGSSVEFPFVGQELHLYYQSGTSLGSLEITFDDDPDLAYFLNQAPGGGEWVHVLDTWGQHTVYIEHMSGGSVNIDRFMILIPATSTPTPTRTPTP